MQAHTVNNRLMIFNLLIVPIFVTSYLLFNCFSCFAIATVVRTTVSG